MYVNSIIKFFKYAAAISASAALGACGGIKLNESREIFQFENPCGWQAEINSALLAGFESEKADILGLEKLDDFWEPPHPYEICGRSKVYANTPKVFSATVDVYTFTGGAHGNTECKGYNYAIDGGRAKSFALADLFKNSADWRAELYRLSMDAIKKESPEAPLFENQTPEENQKFISEFAVSADGITLVYPLYSISPYCAGIWRPFIEREKIEGMLSAKGKEIFDAACETSIRK